MSQEKILSMIQQYGNNRSFTGPVDDSRIKQIENMLEVTLPDDYKWFVRNFGHGGIAGVEILGIAKTEIPTCVKSTQTYREEGLPHSLVVIENCDEWVYCLDTSKLVNGECPVIDWDFLGNAGIQTYKNFYEFLSDRFSDAVENLYDDETNGSYDYL
ncbi:SMI1-KNR4 cell-wall [Melghirimyces thermohalophilus]|uniref:SMI1-KNR4 cell-wall n=1 Tax=Melghirimyces thermohalophilus TaxID=1236220 RepID=A0A1G6PK91_9BACL|nr:SMI1/KNR4 family protein [Melghirimyces thermohalophilus]SDC80479.1 SMI1-KNR4 cell-wall [Melghirimyces thermohalophilus]